MSQGNILMNNKLWKRKHWEQEIKSNNHILKIFILIYLKDGEKQKLQDMNLFGMNKIIQMWNNKTAQRFLVQKQLIEGIKKIFVMKDFKQLLKNSKMY